MNSELVEILDKEFLGAFLISILMVFQCLKLIWLVLGQNLVKQ